MSEKNEEKSKSQDHGVGWGCGWVRKGGWVPKGWGVQMSAVSLNSMEKSVVFVFVPLFVPLRLCYVGYSISGEACRSSLIKAAVSTTSASLLYVVGIGGVIAGSLVLGEISRSEFFTAEDGLF